jgi:transposase
MAKYGEKFKLSVVQDYETGEESYRAVARRRDLDHATVRKWVESYRQHGPQGLCKKRSRYSAQFKLAVLQRMRHKELSARQAVVLFDIRGGTGVISAWLRRYHQGGLDALKPKPREMTTLESKPPRLQPPQGDDTRDLEALRKENEYLRAEVAYLKNWRPWFGPDGKLRRQSASRHRAEAALPVANAAEDGKAVAQHVLLPGEAAGGGRQYASLKSNIQAIYERHKGRYGYRRITAALCQAVNHKTVQRLMQGLGLKSLVRPRSTAPIEVRSLARQIFLIASSGPSGRTRNGSLT